jgi:hypothetical protein
MQHMQSRIVLVFVDAIIREIVVVRRERSAYQKSLK